MRWLLAIGVLTVVACAGPPDLRDQPRAPNGPVPPSPVATLRYPPKAVQLHEEGKATVYVEMLRDGTLQKAELVQSTGYSDLDAEAVDVFYRVGKFPAVPDDKYPGKQCFGFTIPIQFKLNPPGS